MADANTIVLHAERLHDAAVFLVLIVDALDAAAGERYVPIVDLFRPFISDLCEGLDLLCVEGVRLDGYVPSAPTVARDRSGVRHAS